jgi:mannan endo-1,4-beta-mannosidase
MKYFRRIVLLFVALLVSLFSGSRVVSGYETTRTARITVDLTAEGTPISPYIYGSNQELPGVTSLPSRRLGGNRMTGYNWENNASNAGADWFHVSDGWMCDVNGVSKLDCATKPGALLTTFHEQSLAAGAESLITLQMAGYVSRDKGNEVSEEETAPSARWDEVIYQKGSPFLLEPDLDDGVVYMDELVHFLTDEFGSAVEPQGVWGYSLDNEPGLWSHTHPRIHPQPVTAEELVERSIALAAAVKTIDPDALIFAPALYGFNAFKSLQDAPDWATLSSGGKYRWFIDYYLEQMDQASTAADTRLLDVLDVHWYSEAMAGGERIVMGGNDAGSPALQMARMHAPRSFWDATYKEDSWIAKWNPSYLPLLPNLQASIDRYYPDTKLAITEWGFGGQGHVSGGIAVADALGIFGREGIFAAMHWSTEESLDYIAGAYQLYLNYDGQGGQFGDLSLQVNNSEWSVLSVYAALDSAEDGQLHLIVLNKDMQEDMVVELNLAGEQHGYQSAQVWRFDETSPTITAQQTMGISEDGVFRYSFAPMSAYHLVFSNEQAEDAWTGDELIEETATPEAEELSDDPEETVVEEATAAIEITPTTAEETPLKPTPEHATIEETQPRRAGWIVALAGALLFAAVGFAIILLRKKK